MGWRHKILSRVSIYKQVVPNVVLSPLRGMETEGLATPNISQTFNVLRPLGGMVTLGYLIAKYLSHRCSEPTMWDGDTKTKSPANSFSLGSKPTAWDGDIIKAFGAFILSMFRAHWVGC